VHALSCPAPGADDAVTPLKCSVLLPVIKGKGDSHKQGSVPAGTPGNGVPKVILAVGMANGVHRNAIVR